MPSPASSSKGSPISDIPSPLPLKPHRSRDEHRDTGTEPSPPRGFRAHLHHLLPRHTLFHAQIQVHQISSVPLVRGEFAVRWKLKHCVAPPGGKTGLFKLAQTSSSKSSSVNGSQVNFHEKGKEREDYFDNDHDSESISSSLSPDCSSSIISTSEDPIRGGFFFFFSSSSSTPRPTPARGQTVFLPLREHSVAWSQSLSFHLKIPLSRDRENPDSLLPSPAKFVVTQRVVAGDPDAPRNPRLGAVYLNLAEYAGPTVGEVTRRYLLRDSKTNTTLKLTILLTRVGGEKHFVAPPLPKGEILNGLTGLLENDIYNTRPRGFDIYGRYVEEEGEEDSDSSDSHSIRSRSSVQREAPNIPDIGPEAPFEVARLPLTYAYGPKTTETLIEALFNPVQLPNRMRRGGRDNPFVLYVPDSARHTHA
ncbi:hypothetical protein BDZ89DRAFT_1077576 [Hymenopellis radicata]|nr:hypothetical protein BDZ89DRAFT_1077576 [Hymenopellis radicata]